ncbi:MAG: anthranilate phosphoribosyltransferase [Clostridia bacterium]|nr:anthranilate phosphoribosyltransferase [Clostridia bacterium]
MMRQAINRLVAGESLGEIEAEAIMGLIMSGEATPAQIGALLAALRLKGETVEEITGFARAMRSMAQPVAASRPALIDTCGTGGDGSHTFNISTIAALVLAGAGITVAKHGNRSVSSRCGSADVLEALGVKVDLPPVAASRCLDQVGIGFLFAPAFHQAMRYAAGPRKEIGIRTVFNLLGPLTNPAAPPYQVVGVYDADLTEIVAAVLGRLGCRRAFVVHGGDGLDEVTTTGTSKITRLDQDRVETFYLDPEQVGLRRARPEDLAGGNAQENADIARRVLSGEKGPRRDVVLLNAALGLVAAGAAADLAAGLAAAAQSIDSGAAMEKLEAMIEFSQSWAA